jgi:hypothetical protein
MGSQVQPVDDGWRRVPGTFGHQAKPIGDR